MIEIVRVRRDAPAYPRQLPQYLGSNSPAFLDVLGNLDLLQHNLLAFFASVRCPGRFILQAHDLAQELLKASIPTIGGFHSPVEREALTVLVRGEQPIVICPARTLMRMRVPREFRLALDAGRLLLLSPFEEHERRTTVETAQRRNRLVAALAERIFVAYADPGGKTEAFCREVLAWGKPVVTFEGNENLIAMGARIVESVKEWMS